MLRPECKEMTTACQPAFAGITKNFQLTNQVVG